ncbi:MAG: hypothetical protein ACE5JN_13270 [Candidatus Methylomirabilia bacterium]
MPAIINQAGQKFNVDKLDRVSRRHNTRPEGTYVVAVHGDLCMIDRVPPPTQQG